MFGKMITTKKEKIGKFGKEIFIGEREWQIQVAAGCDRIGNTGAEREMLKRHVF
jgi:hypothetical protein